MSGRPGVESQKHQGGPGSWNGNATGGINNNNMVPIAEMEASAEVSSAPATILATLSSLTHKPHISTTLRNHRGDEDEDGLARARMREPSI